MKKIASYLVASILSISMLLPASATYVAAESTQTNPTPVFRFYKYRDGSHFFTNNEQEKAQVVSRPDIYKYEGIAYYSYNQQIEGSSPVYRFYNFKNGVHFYTSSTQEYSNVRDNLSHTYRYEGVAYYSLPQQIQDSMPVHRFYKFTQGIHFYTNNQSEATNLNNTASHTYRYEGVSYYLPSKLRFNGNGSQVSESFILPTTLAVFSTTYSGPSSYFGVWLKEANTGEAYDLIANDIGSSINTSTPVGVGENRYVLDVDSEGSWSVEITQPKSSSGYVTDFTGSGDRATELFSMNSGGRTVSYSHDGSSNFIIWLYDGNGNLVDLIVNEIGATQGGAFIAPRGGNYMFGIQADGNWAISIN